MTPQCGCVADIGCDHGQIMLCLMQNGTAQKGLACDISEASLAKARALFSEYNYDVECIVCDGLEHAAQADCAVIAGIGGITISHILESAAAGGRYVLQPSDSAAELRRFLHNNGFETLRERIIRDGRYYCIIYAEKARRAVEAKVSELTPLEAELGAYNMKHVDDAVLGYAQWRLSVHSKTLKRPAKAERGIMMQADQKELCRLLEGFISDSK